MSLQASVASLGDVNGSGHLSPAFSPVSEQQLLYGSKDISILSLRKEEVAPLLLHP